MEKQPWLEIAEYTAIVGSVLGSVAAVKFQQLAYASAPLAVVVSLNLINRQRFQQQIQEYTISAIAEVRQVVQPLFQQADIPVQNVNLDVNIGAIAELLPEADQITSTASKNQEFVKQSYQVPQKEIIIELQSLTNEINQGFNKLASCLEPEDLTNLKLEISTIKEHLQTVDLTDIKSNIEQLKTQFHHLEEQHHGLPPACDILALVEKMADFEQRNQELDLEEQHHGLPPACDILALTKRMADFEQRNQELLQYYNNLIVSIVPKITHLESEQSSSKQDIQNIKEQLSNLQIQLENLSLTPEANFINIVKAIAPIQAHISSIGSIPEEITQLKLALQDLQEQIKYESSYNQNGYKKN